MEVGKATELYRQVSACLPELISGVVLAVDPSVGSQSSMPGWAVYSHGTYLTSGVIQIQLGTDLQVRLYQLRLEIEKLYYIYAPAVLVYEDIGPLVRTRFGLGRNPHGHNSLVRGVGAILAAGLENTRPGKFVGIKPSVWKRLVRASYRKGDEADAVEMGWICLEVARGIQSNNLEKAEKKSRSKKKTTRKKTSRASKKKSTQKKKSSKRKN